MTANTFCSKQNNTQKWSGESKPVKRIQWYELHGHWCVAFLPGESNNSHSRRASSSGAAGGTTLKSPRRNESWSRPYTWLWWGLGLHVFRVKDNCSCLRAAVISQSARLTRESSTVSGMAQISLHSFLFPFNCQHRPHGEGICRRGRGRVKEERR